MEKVFYRMDNIGKAKYTINFYNGVDTHPDGSAFFHIRTFKSKRPMNKFIKELIEQGYKEVSSFAGICNDKHIV